MEISALLHLLFCIWNSVHSHLLRLCTDVGRGGGRQEKPALKNAGKKGMSCHSPTEIALPQDWTY